MCVPPLLLSLLFAFFIDLFACKWKAAACCRFFYCIIFIECCSAAVRRLHAHKKLIGSTLCYPAPPWFPLHSHFPLCSCHACALALRLHWLQLQLNWQHGKALKWRDKDGAVEDPPATTLKHTEAFTNTRTYTCRHLGVDETSLISIWINASPHEQLILCVFLRDWIEASVQYKPVIWSPHLMADTRTHTHTLACLDIVGCLNSFDWCRSCNCQPKM